MTRPDVLPSAKCTASAPRIGIFRGSMAGLCAPLSTLRRNPRGQLRMTRGRCGDHTAWVHTLAGTNDDMSRFGVMHPCGVGRSTEGDQKALRPKQSASHLLQLTDPCSHVVRGPHRRNL